MFRKHPFKISLAFSILLHLLFILSYKSLSTIKFFPDKMDELLQKNQENQRKIEFEIVETPEDATSYISPQHAELLSDKNSIARDSYQKDDKLQGNPYSEGDIDVKNLPLPKNERFWYFSTENGNRQLTEKFEREKNNKQDEFTYEEFSRQQLLKDRNEVSQMQPQESPNRPVYENRKFSAKDLGGFTFNTYNWDFAPYMLAMKKKVERNIFPPPAFTRMGLINGETLLRFKVMPNGEVKDLTVLKYSGHESLKETSVQAILNSSRFKPLPADFPENFLEVTASFSYYVRRR